MKNDNGVNTLISTQQWLKEYGLTAQKLTRDHVLKKIGFRAASGYVGTLKKNVTSRYSLDMYNVVKDKDGNSVYLTARADDLSREERRLRALINNIEQRIHWLNSGSRETFGVVTEKNVVFIMDSYLFNNVTFGSFASAVASLIREQVIEIDSFNVIRAHNKVSECWSEPRVITRDNLRQSLAFVLSQQPCIEMSRDTICDSLLNALNTPNIDGIYLLVQGSPSLSTHEQLLRMTKGSKVPINTCVHEGGEKDNIFQSLMTEISANTGGRWHIYKDNSTQSKDTTLLRSEMNAVRDVLAEVEALRLELEMKNEPRMPQLPPKSPIKSDKDMSSAEWIKKYGIKATGCNFYDALSSQAFRHCDKVVKLGDTEKIVNAKYCERFAHVKWWDGSVKHVIINKTFYQTYQDKVENLKCVLHKRINWIKQSSKELFGTLLEDNVCILLDTSDSMAPHLSSLKNRLEKLIAEQLRNKVNFTLVAVGSDINCFSESLVRVTSSSLQNAWRWCRALQCSGSTNTLEALKFALSLGDVHGVYLLSDGRPDAPEEKILNQVKLYKQVPIHTISFNCNDIEANEFLATLAQDTGARFHVVSSEKDQDYVGPEPYENTDIKLLRLELESADLDLKKMTELRSECEILEWKNLKKPPAEKKNTRKRRNTKKISNLSDTESILSNSSSKAKTVFNARKWLNKYGLVAQKLTIMDALSPTVITQHPKYVGVLKKKVHAKVFDDVMPFTFHSPEDKDSIRFVNPAAVDLDSYETKVKGAVALYDKKISSEVWKKLDKTEKKKFSAVESEDPAEAPSFKSNEELYKSILDRGSWPISQKNVQLMSEEIELGELYISQSEQLRTQTAQKKEKEVKKERRVSSSSSFKSDSYLLGYRVVAQNSVDGFYYPGTVIGSESRTKCEVEFDDFDRQKVFVNNLIPIQGSTARPKVKAGDYALVQLILNNRSDSKHKLFAPGLVIKSPEHNNDITYIILLFTGERLIASRHDLIKITKHRYKQTSQDIYKLINRQRVSTKLRLVAEGEQDDVGSVVSTLDEILKSNLLLNKPQSIDGDMLLDDMINTPRISQNNEDKLEDMLEDPEEEDTQDDLNKAPSPANKTQYADVGVETQEMAKVTLECGLQVGGYDVDAQTHISNDFWDDLDKVKYQDIIHPSELLVDNIPIPVFQQINVPVLKVSATTPIQTDILSIPDTALDTTVEGEVQAKIVVDGDDSDTLSESFKSDKFFSSSSYSSSSSSVSSFSDDERDLKNGDNDNGNIVNESDLPIGHLVLARWADEGWYFRGKIAALTDTGYLVEDNTGHQEEIDRDHVLVDERDGKHKLKYDDHVVALHPDYSFSYAPARVVSSDDNWFFDVQFYDETKGEIPREEMYYIPPQQYKDDVNFIKRLEDSLLGKFVVARDDSDGLYKQGSVMKCSGRTYEISLKGEIFLQDPAQVFTDGKKSAKVMKKGDYCLCPLDELQETFAPAKVAAVNQDNTLKVHFYDKSELYFIKPGDIYPINKDFYNNSSNFIKSRSI